MLLAFADVSHVEANQIQRQLFDRPGATKHTGNGVCGLLAE
jgi:hypothetical protein